MMQEVPRADADKERCLVKGNIQLTTSQQLKGWGFVELKVPSPDTMIFSKWSLVLSICPFFYFS